ncbi:MAG: hypothetical protein J6K39_01955 [Clostridia bacterium]|nr:hypothetical protein [Clostridia bacterium]
MSKVKAGAIANADFEKEWTAAADSAKFEVKTTEGKSYRILVVKDDARKGASKLDCAFISGKGMKSARFVYKCAVDEKTNVLSVYSYNNKNKYVQVFDAAAQENAKLVETITKLTTAEGYQELSKEMTGVLSPIYGDVQGVVLKNPAALQIEYELKGKGKDLALGYLVVGPHADKQKAANGSQSLYFLSDLKNADGTDKDLTKTEELLKTGIVVHKVYLKKDGKFELDCYNPAKISKTGYKIKGETTEDIKAWVDKNGKNLDNQSEKVKNLYLLKSTSKVGSVLKMAAIGVVLVAVTLPLALGFSGKAYHTEQAANYGANTAIYRVYNDANADGIFTEDEKVVQLLQYKDGKISGMGDLHDILKDKFVYKRQGGAGFFHTYEQATMTAAGKVIGTEVAKELMAKGIQVVNKEAAQDGLVTYIYPVDTLSDTATFSNRESSKKYLKDIGYSAKEADAFLKAYEEGYQAHVKDIASKDDVIGTETQIVKDAINSEDFKVAVAEAVAREGATQSTVGVLYANEDVVFAIDTKANDLYKLELTDGAATLVESVKTAEITKADYAEDMLSKFGYSEVLNNMLDTYEAKAGCDTAIVYLADYNKKQDEADMNKYYVSPTAYFIRIDANGAVAGIEEKAMDKVVVAANKNSSKTQMIALSMLTEQGVVDTTGKYEVERQTAEGTVHEENELTTSDIEFAPEQEIQTVAEDEKTLN